ncbi:MAG: tripartite tricarboxylate transporter substrate binding protein [Rhodocyclaceae bacterium]|nr:tripartite tricarboxylate transporter substrate binding protein [Rhodocyclaceae bacterium]MCA3075721.1 tripartite tricarboxylate transporter substrate binding protein [Rhodocyclaceae bacterium]MCA3089924.1 tripartite tricarboxylate transporter substrate binding protein [Rhodocyclaceae bacterium]MCA3093572.1 tripartite tricarboxylate transporter substrate binding protein [Rhodocyclaceae bacterium]MCA3096389.1 tripartite tricarboxylate transporter substrate binding protein [Rhodocyclaceae bact
MIATDHATHRAVRLARGLLAGALIAAAGAAAAQAAFPVKPVRVIVTFSAGGAADFTARVVAERLTDLWKQQVLVENRVSAGGNVGVEAVVRAPADGYTLLLASSAQPINVALYPKLPFDLFKDLAPIALVTVSPMALAVNPRAKETDLRAFTANMRANPGKLSYATCGIATSHHFAFELYKFQAKLNALHIPYRGCAAAVADAVGGQVDTVMSSLNTLLPHQAGGRLRVLAITARNRSASAPDVPTFRESGVPELKDYASSVYYGFMAPAATPPDIVAKIEADLRKVMALPEVAQKVAGGGLEVAFASGAEMMATMRTDAEQLRRIVEFAGIKPE